MWEMLAYLKLTEAQMEADRKFFDGLKVLPEAERVAKLKAFEDERSRRNAYLEKLRIAEASAPRVTVHNHVTVERRGFLW